MYLLNKQRKKKKKKRKMVVSAKSHNGFPALYFWDGPFFLFFLFSFIFFFSTSMRLAHTCSQGPLVIATATPSFWLNPPRDLCIYVYMTTEIALTSLHPPRPYDTRSHMHTTPSPRPRSSRSHTLRYFGFLSV